MKRYRFFYEQLVTDTEINNAFDAVQNAELNKSTELGEAGVHSGFVVAPTSPVSTSVLVSTGTGRIPSTGRRVANLISQEVACDLTDGGDPTYSDLGVGEGRWCSIFVRSLLVDSVLRTDGHGDPLYYEQSESLEFFLQRGTAGVVADKATLARPGSVSTAIRLSDIWFENGSTDILVGDLDDSRREDYFRSTVYGSTVVEGNPRAALLALGSSLGTLSDADLPTGAADGAHKVGLGGTLDQAEFQWAKAGPPAYLNAAGDDVHSGIAKIVSDLGMAQGQGISGARLVAVDTTPPTWYGAASLGIFGDYDGSIMGAIVAILGDLADGGGGGDNLIASDRYTSGSTYDLASGGSVRTHLEECIDNLNDHVNTSGHPATAISYAGSPAFPDASTLPAATVEATFDTLVTVLGQTSATATTAGTSKIGTNLVTGSFDTLSLPIPGSTSLDAQLIAIMNAVAKCVQVDGDTRLQGDILPTTDADYNLGNSTLNFGRFYVQSIYSTTDDLNIHTVGGGDMYLVSSGDIGITSSGTITIDADSQIVFKEGGANVAYLSSDYFIPATGGVLDLGSNGVRWDVIYANGGDFSGGTPLAMRNLSHIELHDGGLVQDLSSRNFNTFIHCSKFQSDLGTWTLDSSGSFATNSGADYAFFPLDTLRPGQAISRVEATWRGSGVGTVQGRLMRQSHATGSVTALGSFSNSTSLTIEQDGVNVSQTVQDGYTYYIEIYGSAASQRLYSLKVIHDCPKWPL